MLLRCAFAACLLSFSSAAAEDTDSTDQAASHKADVWDEKESAEEMENLEWASAMAPPYCYYNTEQLQECRDKGLIPGGRPSTSSASPLAQGGSEQAGADHREAEQRKRHVYQKVKVPSNHGSCQWVPVEGCYTPHSRPLTHLVTRDCSLQPNVSQSGYCDCNGDGEYTEGEPGFLCGTPRHSCKDNCMQMRHSEHGSEDSLYLELAGYSYYSNCETRYPNESEAAINEEQQRYLTLRGHGSGGGANGTSTRSGEVPAENLDAGREHQNNSRSHDDHGWRLQDPAPVARHWNSSTAEGHVLANKTLQSMAYPGNGSSPHQGDLASSPSATEHRNDSLAHQNDSSVYLKIGTGHQNESMMSLKNNTAQQNGSVVFVKNGTAQQNHNIVHLKNETAQHNDSFVYLKNGTVRKNDSIVHLKNGTHDQGGAALTLDH